MKMIKLIVDSTCDINNEITDNYDVDIIPLGIAIGGISYLDGVDIDVDTVYMHMREGKVPKTSQITYKSVVESIEKCVANNEDFIYLSFSSKMSGTYNFAKKIIDSYKEKYPERKMEVVDSRGGGGGSALIAVQILKMIEQKIPFEAIVKQVHFMANHVVYFFTLADLDWLHKGGRVSKPVSYVGDILNIKPFLTVKDGTIVVSKMVRGSKKVIQTLIKEVYKGTGKFSNQVIAISHADDLKAALKVEQKIKETIKGCRTTIFQIGAVLGTHLGIGGVGVFFFDERPEFYEL